MGAWWHGDWPLRLWPGLRVLLSGLVILSGLVAVSGPARAQNDGQTCTGDLATLRAEIDARQQRLAQSCAPAVELMQSLLVAKQRYSRALVSTSEFRRNRLSRIFIEDLIPLQDLAKVHQEIALEAAAAKVLLDKETAELVKASRAGKVNVPTLFGIPTRAMSFDPAEVARINPLRERHDANYLKMEDFAKDYAVRAQEQVTRANEALAERHAALSDLHAAQARLQTDLRRMFDSRDFEHCLGVPAADGEPGAQSVVQGGAVNGLGFIGVEPEPNGVPFSRIPGVLPRISSLAEVLKALSLLPDPPPPARLPEELAMKRDGVRIYADFREVEAIQDEANRQLANAELLDMTVGNFLRIPGYLAGLGKTIVAGSANAIYQPFVENFTDKSQNIFSAAFNTVGQIGFETVEGVVKSASNLIGDGLDILSPNGLLVQRETEEANRSARQNNLFRAAVTVGNSFLAEVQQSMSFPPELTRELGTELNVPGSATTQAEVDAFIAASERRKEAFRETVQLARDRKQAAAIIEARAFDALNVLGARGTLTGLVRVSSKLKRGLTDTVRDVKTNLKIADTLDEIERLRNTRQSPEVLDEIAFLRDELKRQQKDRAPGGDTRKLIDAAFAKAEESVIGQEVIDTSLQNILDRQKATVTSNRPFKQAGGVVLQDGRQVALGEQVGVGGVKEVFDARDPNTVVQRFNRAGDDGVKRDIEAGNRLRKLGIRTTDDIPFTDEFGDPLLDLDDKPVLVIFDENGRAIKQSERIDGSKEVKEIAENNPDKRLTEEQFAASVEAANKAVEQRHVLIDFKPANIGLELDDAGRTTVNAFDRDGVIDLDEVIRNRRNNPDLIEEGGTAEVIDLFGEKFDLTTVEGARKLQSIIIDGVDPCCPNAAKITQFTDLLTPSLLFQKLDTPGFKAVGTSGATFDGIRPLSDGKPRNFFDADADEVARILDEAKDARILDEARGLVGDDARKVVADQAATIIAASKIIRDQSRTANDIARRVKAIKAAATGTALLTDDGSEAEDEESAPTQRRPGGGGGSGGGPASQPPEIPDTLLGNLIDESQEERRARLEQEQAASDVEEQASRDVIRTGLADDAPSDGFPEGR
ncbi:MAG: hypothetical protein P1U49_01035 [Minwuia sp.]|nr:hypothetical protein [Minwuia sp.]